MLRRAMFSPDKVYRYSLLRVWDSRKPTVMFLMLNPSTADENFDDPTIRRCIGFGQTWGYGGLVVGNLFAYRSPKPEIMKKYPEPIGPENNHWLQSLTSQSSLIVAAWGKEGKHLKRSTQVRAMIPNMHYLKLTNEGEPYHPLYLKGDLKPIPFTELL